MNTSEFVVERSKLTSRHPPQIVYQTNQIQKLTELVEIQKDSNAP